MKIGISTASFFMREESENALERIFELGADCAEIFLGTFFEYRPEFAKANAKRAAGEVSSVHTLSTNFEPQLFSDSRRVRGDGFYWLDQVMRSAQLFGAKKYTFHGFISHGMRGIDFDREGYKLSEIAEFCSRYGVELCLENVAWAAYFKPGLFKEYKARCPNLKGVLDVKQARRSCYPYQAYIADMGEDISYVHLCDINEEGKTCLPGEGIFDFNELFLRLKDAGFCGEAQIEVYGGDYKEYSEIKKSLDYLREIAEKIF